MADNVIKAEGLSKKYTIGHQAQRDRHATLRDVLVENARSIWRKTKDLARGEAVLQGDAVEEIWALRDLSFEVQRGEAVGLIGRNGAGKSTLLKILSRITEPTAGRATIHGRVSSLLEVGTGFHPELTGRENIFLNGAILGMPIREIKRKFDEIVAFAEVEKFLDTPVKHFSSGMYVRLAFAVAAYLEPEILVVDEVLAVGDAAFQKKCLGKMGGLAKGGRTVLFVSHNMQAIRSLCRRAILLEAGRLGRSGDAGEVISGYLSMATGDEAEDREQVWDDVNKAPGNDKIRLRRIAVVSEGNTSCPTLGMDTPFRVEVDFWNLSPGYPIIVDLCFYAADGTPVFESMTTDEPGWREASTQKGLFRCACSIPGNLFNEGSYRIRLIFGGDKMIFDYPDAAAIVIRDLLPRNIDWHGRFIGPIHPALSWRVALLQEFE